MKSIGIRLLAVLLCALVLTGCAATNPTSGSVQETLLPTAEAAGGDKTTGYGWYFDTLVTVTFYGAPEGIQEEIQVETEKHATLQRLKKKLESGGKGTT